MMFLSRLILNSRSRQVRGDLARPYELHRTLLRAFPDDLTVGEERLLYRVETDARRAEPVILVQSHALPAWDRLPEGYLAQGLDEVNPAVKPFPLSVQAGQMLAFRLFANPTKRLGKAYGEEQGKRVGIYKENEQEAWLARKAEAAGFRILQVSMSNDALAASRIVRDEIQHDAKWYGVRFDGALQVVDPARFVAAVESGIGSGKAFGYGLLSLAPMPR